MLQLITHSAVKKFIYTTGRNYNVIDVNVAKATDSGKASIADSNRFPINQGKAVGGPKLFSMRILNEARHAHLSSL